MLTRPVRDSRRKWFVTNGFLVLAAVALAIVLASQTFHPASAVAAPITQCNNDIASNVGGQGLACTVTIINYVDGSGTMAATPPSTVTVTRCTGAAGPVAAGAGTCVTTTTTSVEPVTLVQQCNGSANGGGGVLICNVTITNRFSSSPTSALTPATVYQCIGSVITGPGAPAICTPVNTPGVTSVAAATVGQCNDSGNGGTSVGFICSVFPASTNTLTLAVNIDQCNGSANGGGALVNCRATVTNEVAAAPAGTEAGTPTDATPTPPASAAAPTIAPAPTVAPAQPTPPAQAVPPVVPPTPPPALPPTLPPTLRPPETGNAGLAAPGEAPQGATVGLLGIATIGLALTGRTLVSRRRNLP